MDDSMQVITPDMLYGRPKGADESKLNLEGSSHYDDFATYLVRNQYGREVEVLGKHLVRELKVNKATLIGLVNKAPSDYVDPDGSFKDPDLPDPSTIPVVEGEKKAEGVPTEEVRGQGFDEELDAALSAFDEVEYPERPEPASTRKDGKKACDFTHPDGSPCGGIALKGSSRCRHHPKKAKPKRKSSGKKTPFPTEEVLATPLRKKPKRKR